jgi:ubiquinone/menaquinone biosynthesis C-methylase UbiE
MNERARLEASVGKSEIAARGFTKHLRTGAAVLDIACGVWIPITKSLAARFWATGVDFSTEQGRRARFGVPQAEFIESDIMTVQFPSGSFDAVVASFALFHLPRDQQPDYDNALIPGPSRNECGSEVGSFWVDRAAKLSGSPDFS